MIEADTYDNRRTLREIVLDEIKDLGTKHFTASAEDKKRKIELLEAAFGTSSWTAIEKTRSLEDLQAGYDKMHMQLTQAPSKYAIPFVDDEIPFLEAAQ